MTKSISRSFLLFLLLLLLLLLVSPHFSPQVAVVSAADGGSSSVILDDDPIYDTTFTSRFYREGFTTAPETQATEEFPGKCLKMKSGGDRLVIVNRPSSSSSSTSSSIEVVEKKGAAFLATDLCAMGHTAKDAPLMLSWALDSEKFTQEEVMKEAFEKFCTLQHHHDRQKKNSDQKNNNNNNNKESSYYCSPPVVHALESIEGRRRNRHKYSYYDDNDGNDNSNEKTNSKKQKKKLNNNKKSLRHVVFGNMCMSKDPKIVPNKRTPVFHNVLRSWFDAVRDRIVTLRKHRKQEKEEDSDIEEVFFSDFDEHKQEKKTIVMCFDNIITRRERWRWVRENFHADQFRIALWSHFQVGDNFQKQKALLLTSSSSSSSSFYSSLASEANSDSNPECSSSSSSSSLDSEERGAKKRKPKRRRSKASQLLASVFEKLLPSRSPFSQSLALFEDSAEQTQEQEQHQQKQQNREDLLLSLRSRFPTSLLPLRVTVLVRDEDRHFQEPQVGDFIQKFFGKELVDVKQEKFDSIRGSKGGNNKPPPTHKEQLQILFDTDLLVAAHGAGLAAVLAMRPGTAVIEFFPKNFKYYMYEEAASLSRVYYKRLESPIVWPKRCCHPPKISALLMADSTSSNNNKNSNASKPMLINGLGARACKKCDTFVNPQLVAELVSSALRAIAVAHN